MNQQLPLSDEVASGWLPLLQVGHGDSIPELLSAATGVPCFGFLLLDLAATMSHQDVQMPMFGKAGNSSGQADWAETDNFDVELLAEYLLDDAAMPSVTFDFKMDNTLTGSGVVSPENSEDGALPPVAEQSSAVAPAAALQPVTSIQGNFMPMPAAPAPPALTAPGMTAAPPNVVPQNALAPNGMVQAQHALASAANALAPAPNALAPAPNVVAPAPNALTPSPIAPAPLAPLAPLAPIFPALAVAPPPQPGMVFHQHSAPPMPGALPVDVNAAKRRRVDPQPQQMHAVAPPQPQSMPMLAVAGMNPAALLSGQQLAAAAAQAMQQQGRGMRKKSQAQIDRRRERNRILARRTRLRKKFFFESLQKEVLDLQKENTMLKELVKGNLKPEESKPVLDECDAMEKMPPSVLEAIGETASEIDSKDFNLVQSIQKSQHCFIITDPSLQDNPIVFASDDFCKLVGYKREEVLGRNCRFLQGAETSKEKVDQVRTAVKQGEDVTVTFINYTAEGTAFWNKLFIAALRDAQNNIVNFIGVCVKVACPLPGDPEHGKLLPGEDAKDDDSEDDDGEDA